jgi:Tol biopolymer transport system component
MSFGLAAAAAAGVGATADSPEAAPLTFAPGVISRVLSVSSPAFFPGDKLVIFERVEDEHRWLYLSRRVDGRWTTPVLAPFSGTWRDFEPAVSIDGGYVVFTSSRPTESGGAPLDGHWGGHDFPGRGGNLWEIERRAGGWSKPRRLSANVNAGSSVFEPTLAADGTLYFMRTDAGTGRFHLYRAPRIAGDYGPATPMPFGEAGSADVDPAIAPDQSYIVFGSNRDGQKRLSLYISFNREGTWSKPLRLPDWVNGTSSNQDTHLSADQQTLYFSHDGQIWQVPFQPVLAWARAQQETDGHAD